MRTRLQAEVDSLEWHGEILRETERLIREGKAKFRPSEEAKRRINRKIAKSRYKRGG